jgi:phosphonate transport system substrate-binding protein
MYQYKGQDAVPYYDCTLPQYLYGKQHVPNLPFTHPDTRDEDEGVLRKYMGRVLLGLKRYKQKFERSADSASKGKPKAFHHDFVHFSNDEQEIRFIVLDFEKFLNSPKYFIIGFFSERRECDPLVVQKVWELDDVLISSLEKFPCIYAYITARLPSGEYFNFVFLENYEGVSKWAAFTAHRAAVTISPCYYSWVRINHAVLPHSLLSLLDATANDDVSITPKRLNDLQIIRTKYFWYEDKDCVWRGIRMHACDEVFRSIPDYQPIRPFVFASFLGDNAFRLNSEIVKEIGRRTGLPVKMIDIAALTKDIIPRPSDYESIRKYNIDFAFSCGLSYVKSFPNLIALASPVRLDSKYNGKPMYFADIIVNSNSPYMCIEDLKGKTFAANEKISFSGYELPQYHFRDRGGIEGWFSRVEWSTSHAKSMDFVQENKADAAAIDSVVLDMEFAQKPERRKEFRVLETTRGCAMPPFVAAAWVPLHVQSVIQNAMLKLHENFPALQENGFSRFVKADDALYDDVREVITYANRGADNKQS